MARQKKLPPIPVTPELAAHRMLGVWRMSRISDAKLADYIIGEIAMIGTADLPDTQYVIEQLRTWRANPMIPNGQLARNIVGTHR